MGRGIVWCFGTILSYWPLVWYIQHGPLWQRGCAKYKCCSPQRLLLQHHIQVSVSIGSSVSRLRPYIAHCINSVCMAVILQASSKAEKGGKQLTGNQKIWIAGFISCSLSRFRFSACVEVPWSGVLRQLSLVKHSSSCIMVWRCTSNDATVIGYYERQTCLRTTNFVMSSWKSVRGFH